MKPLKQLPILRLPFRAMEEVSKGMHAIINFSMISKRTRAVAKFMSFYSKYSIWLSVKISSLKICLYGTNKKIYCTYVMTSDKKMNGKIVEKGRYGYIERDVFNYSKDPVEEWKKLSEYIIEIFKVQTISCLVMQMDAFADRNIYIIDFLKTNVKSVDECFLYHWNEENNVAENFAYLLNNVTIDNKLASWVQIKPHDFNGKIPKNLRQLYIQNSQWVGYERLLEIDCKNVILRKNRVSDEQWNLFIKKWIAMETNQNLEYLELDYRAIEEFRALVMHDIPHEVVDEGAKRVLKIYRGQTEEISGGIDIRRIDGKTATFFAHREFQIYYFAMSVN
ncbi:hypothetical protein CRE_21674 [Caenorhabditis remanei]|uniref:Sdz-33 F-box domain-containing protein n=1 Tax=Caenorhabditis remanei TaxID=31234 RepID=E3NSL7_CAERE|nr:hypothetical protein CRE_21674 [Caenorhabditis remanei]